MKGGNRNKNKELYISTTIIKDNDRNSQDIEEVEKSNIQGSAPKRRKSAILGLNDIERLHIKLDHANPAVIKAGIRNGSIHGSTISYQNIKDMEMRICPDCLKGNMKAFPIEPDIVDDELDITVGPMDYMAVDDKGPMPVQSIKHNKRFDLYSFRNSKYLMVKFKKF